MQEDLPPHSDHTLIRHISAAQLDTPSSLLIPRDNSKSEAVRDKLECVATVVCELRIVSCLCSNFSFRMSLCISCVMP